MVKNIFLNNEKSNLISHGGYPLVDERTDDDKNFIIAINPSKNAVDVSLCGEVILLQNCRQEGEF